MAVVIVLSFELVIPQPVVFYAAPLAGLLVGYHANTRSVWAGGPWRGLPRTRPNAGLVTGPTLALLHGAIRLLFFYGDAGLSAGSQGGGVTCRSAADCTCQRYLAAPASAAELRAAGITDASGFERYFLADQLDGGIILLLWTAVPALFGGRLAAPLTRGRP